MLNPKEDYYAALELSPKADSEEIKKQFKKLGTNSGLILPATLLLTLHQPGSIIQIVTREKKISSKRNFRRYRPPMKSSPIQFNDRNTMHNEGNREFSLTLAQTTQ